MTVKLSDYVFRFLADLGVRHVFMLPGGGAMHLVDSAGRCEGLECICNLHEQACAIAAESYARVTNNLGVLLVTTGPGGTNAVTGVAAAWLESTPCLVVSGQVKRSDMKGTTGLRQLGPQELDIVSIVKSITKFAVTVMDPQTIRFHLEKAVSIARSDRKGPVWIDIPLDVQAAQIEPAELPGFGDAGAPAAASIPPDLAKNVGRTIELLNDSERPILLVGNGIRLAAGVEALKDLVRILRIPVLSTWMGADLLSDAHPLFIGKPGMVASRGANFAVQNADFLLSIGARLDFSVTGFDQANFSRSSRKVVVDIDAAEIGKLRMNIDLALCVDAAVFMQEMLRQGKTLREKDRRSWLSRCKDWNLRYPVVLPEYRRQRQFVNTYLLGSILAEEASPSDLIIPGSSGAAIDTFWISFGVKENQRLFSTGGLGAMGFGIPASIGGCIAGGRRRTITVEGDGSFQMNIQELEIIARLRLPIKFFVINNQGYASIRAMQRTHFKGHLVGCDATSGMTLPDVVKQGHSYGIESIRISDSEGLRERIREILNSPGPSICEVMADPEQSVAPRVSSAVRPDGTMISKPLEDMWPFLDREEFLSNMLIPPLPE